MIPACICVQQLSKENNPFQGFQQIWMPPDNVYLRRRYTTPPVNNDVPKAFFLLIDNALAPTPPQPLTRKISKASALDNNCRLGAPTPAAGNVNWSF